MKITRELIRTRLAALERDLECAAPEDRRKIYFAHSEQFWDSLDDADIPLAGTGLVAVAVKHGVNLGMR